MFKKSVIVSFCICFVILLFIALIREHNKQVSIEPAHKVYFKMSDYYKDMAKTMNITPMRACGMEKTAKQCKKILHEQN